MPYLNVEETESAQAALAAAHPGLCELLTLPETSHEGRTIHAMRLANGPADARPALLFIGGQHAREWGSGDICIGFAADLLAAYAAGSGLAYGAKSFSAGTIQRLLDDAQVFVLPCVNPDGKEHSQTSEAMWRKNRNPAGAVDLNRNYDVLWDFATALSPSASAVVSDNPADDTYHGTAPFSEPETRNVKWLLDSYPQIRWFIDIHSFSQLLYHNWGHDQNQVVDAGQTFTDAAFDGQRGVEDDAYSEFIAAADLGTQCMLVQRMQAAIQAVRGISYQTGQSFELYPTTGTATDYPYSRHRADPGKTKTHGFLIEWGTEFQPPFSEMEEIVADISAGLLAFADAALDECGVLQITLESPTLAFDGVPEGETTYRAVTFAVTACCAIDFDVIAGPSVDPGSAAGTAFVTPLGTTDQAPPAPAGLSYARLWVAYTATTDGDAGSGSITVRARQTRQTWVVPITASVVGRQLAAVALVLDVSGSMGAGSGVGPGITRADVLRFAAPPLVSVIEDGCRVGVVTFDHDAHAAPPDALPMTTIDPPGRIVVNGHLGGYVHNPGGNTAIGEGVAAGNALLAPQTDLPLRAMIVLTDGAEYHGGYDRRSIADVADLIGSDVYAIGLGTPQNLQPAALEALCDGHAGYLMMTGALDADALFRLSKYYQQILAGVTNAEIVLDPEGTIRPGQVHEIPFALAETDLRGDVVLLTPAPDAIRLTLRTPAGDAITPVEAAAGPALAFESGPQTHLYRVTLPLPAASGSAHAGTWRARLECDDKGYKTYLDALRRRDDKPRDGGAAAPPGMGQTLAQAAAHGVRYSLIARARSNLRLRARLSRSGHAPGASLALRATLSEYGVPVEGRAVVRARVETPDGPAGVLALPETAPGTFEASWATQAAGVYRFTVLAAGTTFAGTPFTREQTLTGAVWAGGDRAPPDPGRDAPGRRGLDLCLLLLCLLGAPGVAEAAKRQGIDPDGLRRCLEAACAGATRSKHAR